MTLTEKVEKLAHSIYCYQAATRFRSDEPCFSLTKAACREYSGILRGFCWGYLDGYFSTAIRHGITDIRPLQREKMQPLIDTWKRVLKETQEE